ncbi:MAG: GNAT family N-acetyltransferase [Acidobacteriota bacterium]
MTADSEVTIAELRPDSVTPFRAMTFPAYTRLLALEPMARDPAAGDQRTIAPIALVARIGDAPAGLVLAEWPASRPTTAEVAQFGPAVPRLLSLYVARAHRRRGVGGALVAALEDEVAHRGGGSLEAVYTASVGAASVCKAPVGTAFFDTTSAPAGGAPSDWLERIFARRGWTPPAARSLLVRFTPRAAFCSDLLLERRLRAQRRGLEIVRWSEIGADEKAALRASHEQNPWIEPLLVPWRFDRDGFDPSSVAARWRGRIVGWVITHRPTPDIVRFTCSFMHPSLSRRGRIVPLYDAVLRDVHGTCRECSFITPFDYAPMVQFIRRRLAPIASFLGETRVVRRQVEPHDPQSRLASPERSS